MQGHIGNPCWRGRDGKRTPSLGEDRRLSIPLVACLGRSGQSVEGGDVRMRTRPRARLLRVGGLLGLALHHAPLGAGDEGSDHDAPDASFRIAGTASANLPPLAPPLTTMYGFSAIVSPQAFIRKMFEGAFHYK